MNPGYRRIASGRTGKIMSARRIRLASQVSGLFLIGGGVWLAFARAR
jgi:homoserine/homoserine lactone efflux protein